MQLSYYSMRKLERSTFLPASSPGFYALCQRTELPARGLGFRLARRVTSHSIIARTTGNEAAFLFYYFVPGIFKMKFEFFLDSSSFGHLGNDNIKSW